MQKIDKTQPNPHERAFVSRKNPRYYKSYAVTPSNDDSSLVDASLIG